MDSSNSIVESTNEYEIKLAKDFEDVKHTQQLYNKQMEAFLSQLSVNEVLDLIKEIYKLKIKADRITETTNLIQEKFEEKQLELNYLENDIEKLKKDLEKFKFKLEQITNDYHQTISNIDQIEIPPDNQSETIKSNSFRSRVNSLKQSLRQKTNDKPTLSHLTLKQMSPSILDINVPTILQEEEEEEQSEIIVL